MNDEHLSKPVGGKGVKSSSKPALQSAQIGLKTIVTDITLLMSEKDENGQIKFDESHQAKVSGATDIQQSSMSSDPNDTVNFSTNQVSTQLSEHL